MKPKFSAFTFIAFIFALALPGAAIAAEGLKQLKTGQQAPDFELTDSHGKKHKLSQYNKNLVVLEWLNHGCPFVKKFYGAGKMQELQAKYTDKKNGVVWLSINSGAPGKQGTEKPAAEYQKEFNSKATAVLVDPTGAVGKKYGARTTPHMFVIAPGGKLIYQGAMDDHADPDLRSLELANNYVVAALDFSLDKNKPKDKKLEKDTTEPYGCGVKYKD